MSRIRNAQILISLYHYFWFLPQRPASPA